jgi:Flp pilus assembly protein TadD
MCVSRPFLSRAALTSVAALALLPALPVSAQSSGQPVVQPVQGGVGARLNAALGRLARNPRDIDALIEAGVASLSAGDGDAAIGFYQKADALSPGDARIKAGLAGAYAIAGDPVSAIPIFDQAEAVGLFEAARVSDRGLAYDMVGDPVTAQRYYREALMAGPDDETSRRLALSQAIAGDRRGMEVTLAPLLQRQDKAAWRTRAFALAILGQGDEAESIAKSTMPADLATAMSGYLRYMPKLTQAQQSAAANLGHFPRAAEIGRDDPRFAGLARTRPVLASLSPASGSVPVAGRPSKRDRKPPKDAQPVRTATLAVATPPPVPQPRPVPAAPVVRTAADPVPVPPVAKPPVPTPSVTTAPVAPAPPAQVAVVAPPPPAPPQAEPKPQPGFATLDPAPVKFDLKPSAPAAVAPAPAAPPEPAKPAAPTKPRNLAEVFADLTPPSREAEPQAGAVDLRKLKNPVAKTADPKVAAVDPKAAAAHDKACAVPDPKAARTAKGKVAAKTPLVPCKDDKAKALGTPSRFWVQLATGKDRKGLAFDWRKLAKDDPALFKGRKAYASAMGQSTRLLTGPFDTAAQAAAFVAQLKKAGVGGAFAWTSPVGQAVDALPGG